MGEVGGAAWKKYVACSGLAWSDLAAEETLGKQDMSLRHKVSGSALNTNLTIHVVCHLAD